MSRKKNKNKNNHKQQSKVHSITNSVPTVVTPPMPKPGLKDITKQVRVPKLLLTSELLASIHHCHHQIKNVEWSGSLIYSFDNPKFSIHELYDKTKEDDITITANKFLFRDIGSSTLTEFELTTEQQIEQGEYQMEGKRIGLIHTHHDMTAYFSGTDNAELQDNTPHHEVYLSLVVNHGNKNDYVARLCFKGQVESVAKTKVKHSFSFLNKVRNLNSQEEKTTVEDVIFYIDLEIVREEPNDYIQSAITKVKEAKAAAIPKVQVGHNWPTQNRGIGYNTGGQTSLPISNIPTTDTSPISSNRTNVQDTVKRMTERGMDSSVKYSFKAIGDFLASWFSGNVLENRTFWTVATAMKNKIPANIDLFIDGLSERWEESILLHFGDEEDSPLHCLEVILICHAIKGAVNFEPHSSNPVVIAMLEMIEDTIREEEELLEEHDLEEAIKAESTVTPQRGAALEKTVEMDDNCLVCEGEGYIEFGGGVNTCKVCYGLGVVAPTSMYN